MAKKTLTLTNWEGGIAGQEKRGIAGSARFIKNLNPHEDDSYLTLTPKTSKVSGSTVTGLVQWAADGSPWDTNRYFYDDRGKIYRETSGGTWSSLRTVTDGLGEGMAVFNNYLYYANGLFLGRYGRLTATPSFSSLSGYKLDGSASDVFSDAVAEVHAQFPDPGGSNTYTIPTSLSETSANKITFTALQEPLFITRTEESNVGTGDITFIVHDANNVEVGRQTHTNAELGSRVECFFDTPVRLTIGNVYHIHITSTVADSTIDTAVASNLSNPDQWESYASPLIDDSFHPMEEFLNMLVIGNERYLATWDEATYNPNRITFGPQYRVRALTKIDEYIVAGCWRGSNVDDEDLGRLYFWDGISTTFNFFKDVPMGVINAMISSKNRLLGVYGSSGKIYMGVEEFKQIGEVPKLSRGKKIEVFPGAITSWQGLTAVGIGANTDDATGVEQGVYIFGSQDDDHPEVFTLGHTISTGTTQGTGLEIGCVAAFGADMYIGWKDSSIYGVDKVSKTSNPNTSGVWESLVLDNGNPKKEKMVEKIVVTFEPLESGESITPKYKIDRATSFTNGTAQSAVGATSAEILLDSRYKEFEWGFDVATSTTFPKITSTSALIDDLAEERNE